MRPLVHGLITSAALSAPVAADALRDAALQVFGPLPTVESNDSDNAKLGRALFFDARLSATGTQSCATCHDPTQGWTDGEQAVVGHDWQTAPRNTSTVQNAVLNDTPSWDLLAEDSSPVLSGLRQMGASTGLAALAEVPDYAVLSGEGSVSLEAVAEAIDTWLATQISPAPFDAWLNGDDSALSAEAKAGLQLFMDHGCVFCHYGPNLGGIGYYPFGLVEVTGAGQAVLSDTSEAGLDFRASPLRNVALTAPYFHSGRIDDLGVAVAVMAESQLGSPLAEAETAAIVAFLQSLSGEVAP